MRMYAATKDTHCDALRAAFFFVCTSMPTLNVPPRLPLLILHGALIKHGWHRCTHFISLPYESLLRFLKDDPYFIIPSN